MTDIPTNVYTLREFRAKTKEAFDDADAMVDVIIKRGTKKYMLMTYSFYEELLKPEPQLKITPKDDWGVERSQNPLVNGEAYARGHAAYVASKPCKHGSDPQFCKLSKPGKPCK